MQYACQGAAIATMYSFRILVVLALALLATVSAMPSGFGGGKHEHYVIHVPYHVHTVHKYHKVPVYIKEKVYVKEHHHHHHDDHHYHHDDHHYVEESGHGWGWD